MLRFFDNFFSQGIATMMKTTVDPNEYAYWALEQKRPSMLFDSLMNFSGRFEINLLIQVGRDIVMLFANMLTYISWIMKMGPLAKNYASGV